MHQKGRITTEGGKKATQEELKRGENIMKNERKREVAYPFQESAASKQKLAKTNRKRVKTNRKKGKQSEKNGKNA